jgi:hypothetical protein
MMHLQEVAGQFLAAEAAASQAESAMWGLRSIQNRPSDYEDEVEVSDSDGEDWSPGRASARVASAASAAVAAAAVEEVSRLRAELAERDRQIAEFRRTETANER